MKKYRSLFRPVNWLCLLWLATLFSCNNADNIYSTMPARFVMDNTYQAPTLYTALNSLGEFCTISIDITGKKYVFQNQSGKTDYVTITAIGEYANNWVCLTGFIVGLPNIPELGADQSKVVAFERACPNCYLEYNFTKPLNLESGGMAKCTSCKRTYDLNNLGITENGRPLFRYRANYVSNTLIINNI